MAGSNPNEYPSLPPHAARTIDRICDRFEADWKAGWRPRIEDFLADLGEPERTVLLKDLLGLELEIRRKNGEIPKPDRYLPRFSDHHAIVRQVFTEADSPQAQAFESAVTENEKAEMSETRGAYAVLGTKQIAVSKKLGRFELIEVVGQGAFGTVYRARDPQLDRDVALKIPRSGVLVEREDVNRFLREARAAAQLRHPNIVAVYEAGKTDHTYFIASAFVRGTTLRETIGSGRRFTHEETARIVSQLASALHYAHTQGIIHRDVKPANIMFDEHGEPHIMDFGLARRTEGDALRTIEGTRLGTPAYMSPEQAQGESHQADARTDVWSLGVILYELLTGRRPFQGNEVEVLNSIREQDPSAPRSVDSSIPRDLETICVRCLAKDRKDRFASAQRLADELDRWLRNEPINSRPIGFVERTSRWFKREPMLAGLTSAATVLALVGTLVAAWTARHAATSQREIGRLFAHAQEQETTAEKKTREALEQARVAEEQSEIAKKSAQRAGAALEERRREEEGLKQAKEDAAKSVAERMTSEAESGEALSKAQQESQRATEASKARQETEAELESRIRSLEYAKRIEEIDRLAMSGDKKRAAVMLAECNVRDRSWEWGYLKHVCENADSAQMLFPADPDAAELIFTANGELAITSNERLTLFDPETNRSRVISLQNGTPVLKLLSSKTIVSRTTLFSLYSYSDGDVAVLRDLATGKIRGKFRPLGDRKTVTRMRNDPGVYANLATYSLDPGQALTLEGDVVAMSTGVSSSPEICGAVDKTLEPHWAEIRLFDTRGEQPPKTFPAFEGTWEVTNKSTHQRHPVYSSLSPLRTLGEAPDNHVHEKCTLKISVNHSRFSPDGKWFVASATDGKAPAARVQIKWWDLSQGSEMEPPVKGVWPEAFSEDGKLFASQTDNSSRLWDTSSGQEVFTAEGRVGAFSPDGKRLAVFVGNTVDLLDTSTGNRVLRLQVGGEVRRIAFSPDSKRMAALDSRGTVCVWKSTTQDATAKNQ